MALIWSTFTMIQLITVILKLKQLKTPPHARLTISKIKYLVNFEFHKHHYFVRVMENYFYQVKQFIDKFGIMVAYLIGVSVLALVLIMLRCILSHSETLRDWLNQKIADLRYKEIIKVLLTSYLSATITAFEKIQKVQDYSLSSILVLNNFGFQSIFPFMVIVFLVLTKHWNRFGNQTLTTRFGHFYAGIKIA